jgi:hypothetical protein
VFISTGDLAYVHAHATPAAGGEAHEEPSHAHGDYATDMEMTMEEPGGLAQRDAAEPHRDHGGPGSGRSMSTAPAEQHAFIAHGDGEHGETGVVEAKETTPASLLIHVAPPARGNYALWIQFAGDGEVRTARFMISVQ